MITSGTNAVGIGMPYSTDSSVQEHALGDVIFGNDGAKFVYVKAGAANLVAGYVCQAPAEDTADQGIAATATAAGATSITTAAMTVTKNQYAGGYVVVTVTPGLATRYRIASHDAYTAAAATFVLEEPIQVALTSSSRLDFIPNPYNGVIINPTTHTSAAVGVAVNDVTAGQYGWLQTAGVGVVVNDANAGLGVGTAVMYSPSVAGAVRLQTAGYPILGRCLTGGAASEAVSVILTIS